MEVVHAANEKSTEREIIKTTVNFLVRTIARHKENNLINLEYA